MGSRSGINKVKKVAAAVGSKERRTDGGHMTSIPGDRGSHLFRHGVHSKYAMARRLFVEEVDASIFTRYLSVLVLMKTPDCFLAMLQWRFDGHHQQPLINSFTLSRCLRTTTELQ